MRTHALFPRRQFTKKEISHSLFNSFDVSRKSSVVVECGPPHLFRCRVRKLRRRILRRCYAAKGSERGLNDARSDAMISDFLSCKISSDISLLKQ